MSDEPIDFSPLDPQRDERRWQSVIDAIADSAARRAERPNVWTSIVMSWRLALSVATAVAVTAWLVTQPLEARQHDARAAAALLSWAEQENAMTTAALLSSVEARDD